MAKLTSVGPVSDEDTNALPVKNIADAIAFYENVLGFSVVSRDSSKAALARDNVQIGLIRKPDHQPGQAGSIAFAVDDLEALRRELEASGGNPGELGLDEWGGKRHRTFFVRETENGYCYCFYCPVSPNPK
jgi:catechol 2,3-dioxygenase-like lactoylglutathione lyase family enzyme